MSGPGDDPPQPFRGAWPATAENASHARHAVRRYLQDADTADPPASDVVLALSEAVTNAIRHAYEERTTVDVRVDVRFTRDEIEVRVEDDGRGLAPRTDSPGLGLGLPLIATLAERFDMQTPPSGGTRLEMTFPRDPSAATLPK